MYYIDIILDNIETFIAIIICIVVSYMSKRSIEKMGIVEVMRIVE